MNRINSLNKNNYLVLNNSYTGENIYIDAYNEKFFEGVTLIFSKEQAKELVNKLQELIYDEKIEEVTKTKELNVPKKVLNTYPLPHSEGIYGTCPHCGATVNNYSNRDNCTHCSQLLKWR